MGRIDDAFAGQKLLKQEDKGLVTVPDLFAKLGLSPETPEPEKVDLEKSATMFGIPLQKPEAKEAKEAKEPEKSAEEAAKQEEKAEPEPEPKPEVPAFTIPDDLKSIVGEDVTEAEGVFQRLRVLNEELEQERTANNEFAEFLESDPALKGILSDYLQYRESNGTKGRPLHEAFRVHAKVEEDIPDPQDDPEAYARFVQKQEERKAQARIETEKQRLEAERGEKMRTQAANHARALRSSFQKEMKLSDEQMSAFEENVKRLLNGDPKTGQLPSNVYHALWRATNYEKDIATERERLSKESEQAAKKAADDARKEAEEKAKKLKAGDSLKHFDGGKGGSNTGTQTISKELEPMAKIAFSRGRIESALAEKRNQRQ